MESIVLTIALVVISVCLASACVIIVITAYETIMMAKTPGPSAMVELEKVVRQHVERAEAKASRN